MIVSTCNFFLFYQLSQRRRPVVHRLLGFPGRPQVTFLGRLEGKMFHAASVTKHVPPSIIVQPALLLHLNILTTTNSICTRVPACTFVREAQSRQSLHSRYSSPVTKVRSEALKRQTRGLPAMRQVPHRRATGSGKARIRYVLALTRPREEQIFRHKSTPLNTTGYDLTGTDDGCTAR